MTLKNSSVKPTLVPLVQQQVAHTQQQPQQQQHIQQQQLDPNTMTISGNDYLSSIVQSVGIKVRETQVAEQGWRH